MRPSFQVLAKDSKAECFSNALLAFINNLKNDTPLDPCCFSFSRNTAVKEYFKKIIYIGKKAHGPNAGSTFSESR